MAGKGTRYNEEMRTGAIRLIRENGRNVQTVSKDLGIAQQTLHRWLKEDDVKDNGENARLKQMEIEIKQLKKDKADLEDTVEILKKAAAIFAAPQKSNTK